MSLDENNLVLGIESTCDDTCASVVRGGRDILSNIVSSQNATHAPYQGVVPELASRRHLEMIQTVVELALKEAGVKKNALSAIAASTHPGLSGSLLVGTNFARGLAMSLDLPFIPVNHLAGHFYALQQRSCFLEYPAIGLLVSGGHTLLCKLHSPVDIDILGSSLDDAIGEAMDKVAKHYQLGYPGGPIIDRMSQGVDTDAFRFPKPKIKNPAHQYCFSYSGLKTVVFYNLEKYKLRETFSTKEVLASFQKHAVDLLLEKVRLATKNFQINNIAIAGGVSANSYLRETLSSFKEKYDWQVFKPDMDLCMDNAAMIAGLGHYMFGENQSLKAEDKIRIQTRNASASQLSTQVHEVLEQDKL